MIRPKGQHHAAEREILPLLRLLEHRQRGLATVFPRPLEDVIATVCDCCVCFEPGEGLHAGLITRVLHDKYQLRDRSLPDDDTCKLAGYLYAHGDTAVIFYDRQYGAGFERFTIAHEAGHLFLEFVPMVKQAKQASLFEATPARAIMDARDTLGQLLPALDPPATGEASLLEEHERLKKQKDAWLREKKANTFAAELLAPHREIKRLLSQHPHRDPEQYVDLVRQHFNLSRRAAEVRLAELSDEVHPSQEILRLLG